MKLSELKPCAVCGGPLPPMWQIVRMSVAFLNRANTSAVMGTGMIVGGGVDFLANPKALMIAEAMSPGADDAVTVGMDKDKGLMVEFHICNNCYLTKHVHLAMLTEKAAKIRIDDEQLKHDLDGCDDPGCQACNGVPE